MDKMIDTLFDRLGKVITGDIKPEKPSLVGFINTLKAVEMLRKHIKNNSRIVIHADVDVDGIGSAYIIKAFLESQGVTNLFFMINKDKVHGIQQKHVDYLATRTDVDLVIVVDSSSNEINTAKQFNCDVLIVDHHEVLHRETSGITNDGRHSFILVTNMIKNNDVEGINSLIRKENPEALENVREYDVEHRMSGALVLYELLRVYSEVYKTQLILDNLLLYQWVGVTLFSDSIQLSPERNQWYIEQTIFNRDVESTLQIIMKELNRYKDLLDKTFILFTFIPTINKAIRAGFSGDVLDIILYRPQDIAQIQKYSGTQAEVLNKVIDPYVVYREDYIMKDITNSGVSKNYCGVIAAKLVGMYDKNAVAYLVNSYGIAEGSFRGRRGGADYRAFFTSYGNDVYAQGHKQAFGFKIHLDKLKDIMSNIASIETEYDKLYITAGDVTLENTSKYHINDFQDFKLSGKLLRLAIANSKLSTEEQLEILTSSSEATLISQKGKLYVYDVFGLRCKAFEPITSNRISIYPEYNKQSNSIEVFVRNVSRG